MKHGFSLVELSIVLVILGLLTGGILAGQSLIRASELRSIATDFQRLPTAINTFRSKYIGLPGDLTNATSFWGSAGGTGADATCIAAQTQSSAATCNGTGDGNIQSITGYVFAERYLIWKQLANAGLIEGSYSGKSTGSGVYTVLIGENLPPSRLSNGFYDIYLDSGTNSNAASIINVNSLTLFGNSTTYGLIRPEEAWNLDTKLDDGSPVYGRVYTNRNTAPAGGGCATSDAATATYDLTNTSTVCVARLSLR